MGWLLKQRVKVLLTLSSKSCSSQKRSHRNFKPLRFAPGGHSRHVLQLVMAFVSLMWVDTPSSSAQLSSQRPLLQDFLCCCFSCQHSPLHLADEARILRGLRPSEEDFIVAQAFRKEAIGFRHFVSVLCRVKGGGECLLGPSQFFEVARRMGNITEIGGE
mmetsp:Transcript_54588/g.119473  ORF Transcript_54588/g.119473 Transcript_54588/m.119473 type:complete len:160 (+) Transcript_54588:37-516(+)